jgi:hypothetical protein
MDTYKIIIPEPCHENWDKMTPNDNGRFCLSCNKNVVDFTKMVPDEIKQYFVSEKGENICGRFKNSQLDQMIIQIPSRVLHSQTHYHKMFLLALFIAMGTTLFSCSNKNGDKQKIDKVEVVSPEQEGFATGGPRLPVGDAAYHNNPVDYEGIKNQVALDAIAHPEIGMTKFYEFIKKNYVVPEKCKNHKETIYLSFIVEKDGTLSEIKIKNNIEMESAKEILRVLKTSPKWAAGKINNHEVRSVYNMPIRFK